MTLIFNFFLFFYILFGSITNASLLDSVDIFSPKEQTPTAITIHTLSKPDTFGIGNDLTRYVGSFYVAVGELLYLKGTITDSFGVPIEGAVVKIWHTNSSGNYQTLLKEDDEYYDKNFTMSGTAKTDNLGRYGFKTIFPGYFGERAPHINIVVQHKNFDELQTEIYFKEHPLNEKDPQYMSYTEDVRKALTANVKYLDTLDPGMGKVAIFNIILNGIHSYKGY